ncbi:MAG TPA: glycosyltransferase [Mycobacteriales bacterium]|nr:glycosyltransferase [Mycobacteriales bacterium]
MNGTTTPQIEPLVTVIVVTYNSGADVEACLTSLQRATPPESYEVFVVDNASSDGSAELAEAWAASVEGRIPVTVIRNGTNVGYAAANNQAAAQARGRLLALVNPDAVLADGCLGTLVEHLIHANGVGAAAAVLTDPDGTPQAFARRDLSLGVVGWDLTEVGRRIDERFRGGRGRRHRRYVDELAALGEHPVAVDCPAAACVVLWRDLAGDRLFDERLPLFFNDADLFRRMRDRAYRCDVVPAAHATHGYGTSHRQVDDGRKRAEFVASLRRYAGKHFPLRFRVALTVLLLADAVSALLLYAVQRKRRLKAHALGTLGGLWLPGGAAPWLTPKPPVRRRLATGRTALGNAVRATLLAVGRRRRRRRLIRRIRWQAWLHRAPVEVDIARSADVGRDITLQLRRGRHSRIVIGHRASLGSGLWLRLWGGTLVVGDATEVRRGVALIVKGRLDIGAHCLVSRDAQVHADGVMVIGFGAAITERCTVVDTLHAFDDVPVMLFEKGLSQADVTFEPYSYIGAGTVVMPGVTIGRLAVVAAQSLVSRDVPPAMVAAGTPAQVVRPVGTVLSRLVSADR